MPEHGGLDDRRIQDARIFVANLQDVVSRLPVGAPAPAITVDASDRTGSVHCLVDLLGTPERVAIDEDWWQRVGPAGVGRAVWQALEFARSKATMARLTLARHGCSNPDRRLDYSQVLADGPAEPMPDYNSPRLGGVLVRKTERAMTILDRAEALRQARETERERVITGPRGLFRVVMSGAVIARVEANEQVLKPSDAAGLAEDATQVLRRATDHQAGLE
ncbi:hypothetical protein ACSNN7_01105 [Micromonospora sp. URMC 105]|uniref:hypothetical protein n=1 Tax=Micromonospora sp. URMC 105 TaxID=3423413 RepID=UPI003F1D8D3E